jgi:LPXTG-motif cell wall-anchored protein
LRFQLVLKVVDPEVLMGVKSEKYENSIRIIQDNQVIETDAASPVTLSRKTVSKTVGETAGGSVLPFQIVVNELEEDLRVNSDKVVLVDELSSDLILDLSSIEVTDKNGNQVTDINIAVETVDGKTHLKLTLPDQKKLTISYEAMVNAMPDKKVSISNSAYWEGYSDTGAVVENTSFSYSVDGISEVEGHANLKLTKRDAQNIQKKLQGATYTMQEAKLLDDGTYELTGEVHTATTDENGELVFSAEDNWMLYNTIYCLTEIEAPEGYVCDPTPKYIVLATKSNMTDYPEEILVRRNVTQFIYEATDDEEKVAFELPETGGTGPVPYYVMGGLLVAVAAAGYRMKKRHSTVTKK